MLMIKLTSVMVDDQAKALAFYTNVLGFQTAQDFPVGEYRWITVVAPGREDLMLALEPNANGKQWQAELFGKKIPAIALESSDLDADYARLTEKGVAFTQAPMAAGPVRIAILADTVGNLVQLYQLVK
ncbi:MAG: VOC family protein [Kofleriaceae bacterium]